MIEQYTDKDFVRLKKQVCCLQQSSGGASSGDASTLQGQNGAYYLDYTNATNKPIIPTNNNQLTNGAAYITSSALSPYLTTSVAITTYVPLTRTVNGKALSSNITLLGSDITSIPNSSLTNSTITINSIPVALGGSITISGGGGGANIDDTTASGTTVYSSTKTNSSYLSLLGGTITGTAGAGYIGLIPQSSNPVTPASGVVLYARSTGAFSWKGSNGFQRTFLGTGLTADRDFTLPDATTTLVGTDNVATLTNKSISGATNTLTAIPLSTAVTGVLPLANGGTGSATQNFVDLSTNQTGIVGTKQWTGMQTVQLTTEQLRLAYDSSNYASFAVNSTGILVLTTAGTSSSFATSSAVSTGNLTANGSFATASTLGNGNINVFSSNASGSTSISQFLILGSSSISTRVGIRGAGNSIPGAGIVSGSFIIAQNITNIATSGTHPLFAQQIIRPLSITATTGSGVLTNSASLYIENAATGAVNNYALWVDDGITRLDGVIQNTGAATYSTGGYSTAVINTTTGNIEKIAAYSIQSWSVVTSSQALAPRQGLIANSSSLLTFTLPATTSVGDIFPVTGLGSGGWKIAQNAGQVIKQSGNTTTTGTGGSIASATQYDSIELICLVANTTFTVRTAQGNLTIT